MDINIVNNQSIIISSQAIELQRAITYLLQYKTLLSQNWYGPELTSINIAIDKEVSNLRKILEEINSISNDMKKAAQNIQREEMERLAREKAAKEKKLNEAKHDLDSKQKEYDKLVKQRSELEKRISTIKKGGASKSGELISLVAQLSELMAKIVASEKMRDQCLAIIAELSR